MMLTLEEYALRRQRKAGKKYLIEVDGKKTNAAFYRDNCLDVAEELGDALTIFRLLQERLIQDDVKIDRDMQDYIERIEAMLAETYRCLGQFRKRLPESYKKDLIPVKRALTWDDIKYPQE